MTGKKLKKFEFDEKDLLRVVKSVATGTAKFTVRIVKVPNPVKKKRSLKKDV